MNPVTSRLEAGLVFFTISFPFGAKKKKEKKRKERKKEIEMKSKNKIVRITMKEEPQIKSNSQ